MKVLVVGAGPTGLTLANELTRHGVQCRIIDSSPGPCLQSRALGIHARTLEHLERMDLIDKFLAEGNPCDHICMYDDRKKILTLSLAELDSPYPFALLLPQSETERILQEKLEQNGLKVERNTTLAGLQQKTTSAVGMLVRNDGDKESVEFDWIVGCDGAHSAVRHAVNASFEGSAYSETFVLADVTISGGESLDRKSIHMFTTEQGLLGMFLFSGTSARIIADATAKAIASGDGVKADGHVNLPPPTLESMQALVTQRGPAGILISDPRWLAAFRIQCRQVNSYRHGRVFLAGDAAHIHSPAGGQGMNTGMQDAINLAWKLALVVNGAADESLLDSYQVERHAVGQAVLKLSDFLTKVNTLRNPVALHVRNKIAPMLAGQEVIQERMRNDVSELAISYRSSPIVAEQKLSLVQAKVIGHSTSDRPELGEWFDFDRGPRGGDRAPDAHLSDAERKPVRLFECLRGPEHHLLLFTGARSSIAGNNTLSEIAGFITDKFARLIKVHTIAHDGLAAPTLESAGSHLIDTDLSMHHRYGASSECLYLIRPDGYIGYRSLPADKLAVDQYLNRIFV